MRAICLYKRETDYGREVEEYLTDLNRMGAKIEVEAVDPETYEGESLARAYDVVRYPAILIIADNGMMVESFIGLPLPEMEEVAYYLNS